MPGVTAADARTFEKKHMQSDCTLLAGAQGVGDRQQPQQPYGNVQPQTLTSWAGGLTS